MEPELSVERSKPDNTPGKLDDAKEVDGVKSPPNLDLNQAVIKGDEEDDQNHEPSLQTEANEHNDNDKEPTAVAIPFSETNGEGSMPDPKESEQKPSENHFQSPARQNSASPVRAKSPSHLNFMSDIQMASTNNKTVYSTRQETSSPPMPKPSSPENTMQKSPPASGHSSPIDKDNVFPKPGKKRRADRSRSPSPKRKRSVSSSPKRKQSAEERHYSSPSKRRHHSPDDKYASSSPRRQHSPEHRRRRHDKSRSPVGRYDRDRRRRSRSRSRSLPRDHYRRSRHSPRRRYSPRHRSPPRISSRRRSPKRKPWSPPPNRNTGLGKPGNNLFIAGFSFDTTERDLERKFSRFGRVTDVRIVRDKRSGESRGFGFLTLERDDDADAAIRALDQSEWKGRIILIEKAKTSSR